MLVNTFFLYEWKQDKQRLQAEIEEDVPDNITEVMLSSEESQVSWPSMEKDFFARKKIVR